MTNIDNYPNFEFHLNKNSDTLDIVLQGGSYGIETQFMQKVIKTCKSCGHSVMAFNFLYYERGEDYSSGKELIEELKTLRQMLDFVHAKEFKNIRFVSKSLGGIVASFYLDKLEEKPEKYSIIILGYVTGGVRLKNFAGPISIIQGEKDKFGNIQKVKADLKKAKSKKIKFFEIKDADHSFRDPKTKEPKYEDEAMKILYSLK